MRERLKEVYGGLKGIMRAGGCKTHSHGRPL